MSMSFVASVGTLDCKDDAVWNTDCFVFSRSSLNGIVYLTNLEDLTIKQSNGFSGPIFIAVVDSIL